MRTLTELARRFLTPRRAGSADLHERVTTLEADLTDLTRRTHSLRLRLSASEAMTIALARAHPDQHRLITLVHSWMTLPDEEGLSTYLRTLGHQEHDRVMSHWDGLLDCVPAQQRAAARTLH